MPRFLLAVLILVTAASVAMSKPVPIVENHGQFPDQVLFHTEGNGGTVYFTATGVVLDLHGNAGRGTVIHATFDGARAPASVAGLTSLPTRFSYFRGNDPGNWQRGVPTWSTVVYRDQWPGVDVHWWLEAHGLRYEIVADPAAAPHRVALRIEGATPADGIVWTTVPSGNKDHGTIQWSAITDTELREDDPVLIWSTFLGQADTDKGLAIVVTGDGYPVAVGRSRSVDFPTTVGSYSNDNVGLNDVFVAKFTPDGSTLVWGTLLGSSGDDAGMSAALDPSGDIVLTGLASAADWPTTAGAYDETGNGLRDAVVARLSAEGDDLQWSTYLGGNNNDVGNRLLIDPAGCPVIIGETFSFDWPTTPAAHDRLHSGGWDVFVTRLSADGSTLAASTLLGGAADDLGRDLAQLADGRVIVVGGTHSPEFPVTAGAFSTMHAGIEDGYVACVDPAEATLVWSTFLGGTAADIAMRVAIDAGGRPVITGGTGSSNFPVTAGAYDETHNGHDDAFVAKLAADGSGLLWSTFLGGGNADRGLVIELDASDHVAVMGYTLSTDLPTTPNAFDETANGSYDIFIHQLTTDGAGLMVGTYLGGEGRDETYTAAADGDGNLLLIGMTHSPDFPVTSAAYDTTYAGNSDAFVAKIRLAEWSLVAAADTPPLTLRASSYPNPFNPRVTIGFTLPQADRVMVRMFDAHGRLVRELLDGPRPAGHGEIVWDGRDAGGRPLASGTYLYELRTSTGRAWGKSALVR